MTTHDYAIGHLDAMGDGPGFRRVRRELGVSAFGVNGLVIPPGYVAEPHFHDRQEELYFVHRGVLELRFPDGTAHRIEPGGLARVGAATVRTIANPGEEDAIVLAVGGADGHVGRDGRWPEREAMAEAG